jgi:hypothetical protein
MLSRAESRRQVSALFYFFPLILMAIQLVDKFIFDLARKDVNAEKRHKISSLALDEEEWMRVHLFCNLLQVCHNSS